MPLTNSLRDDILAAVPTLRAFAISLSGNADRADDLVQETLLRATANIDSFQPGTNMLAWLFTILRNQFSVGISQTTPRSRRRGRQLPRQPDIGSRATRPLGVQGTLRPRSPNYPAVSARLCCSSARL